MTYIKNIEREGYQFKASNFQVGMIYPDPDHPVTGKALIKRDKILFRAYCSLMAERELIFISMNLEEYENEWDRINAEKEEQERKTNSEEDRGIIYLLKTENNEYKIGLTRRPINQRLKEISPKMPTEIELIGTVNSNQVAKDEKFLHDYFRTKKIRGEWYSLTEENVDFILNGGWTK